MRGDGCLEWTSTTELLLPPILGIIIPWAILYYDRDDDDIDDDDNIIPSTQTRRHLQMMLSWIKTLDMDVVNNDGGDDDGDDADWDYDGNDDDNNGDVDDTILRTQTIIARMMTSNTVIILFPEPRPEDRQASNARWCCLPRPGRRLCTEEPRSDTILVAVGLCSGRFQFYLLLCNFNLEGSRTAIQRR